MPSGALISTHGRSNGGGSCSGGPDLDKPSPAASDDTMVSSPEAVSAAAAATKQQEARRGHAAAKTGTHVYSSDVRNADVLVGIRDGVLDAMELVSAGDLESSSTGTPSTTPDHPR